MELLYVQGMLNNTRGREIDNPGLNELLQILGDLAHNAEDVLDELDYFRIQDELYGTCEAADEHAKGCIHNLFLNTHHTAKAVGKLLACSSAASLGDPGEEDAGQRVRCCAWTRSRQRARDNISSAPNTNQVGEEVSGCMRKLGKFLPCSSLPSVESDDDDDDDDSSGKSILDDDDSGKSILCCACMRKAPTQRNNADETPKLEFNRVDISKSMVNIVSQLKPMRQEVSTILLGCSRSIAQPQLSRPITTSEWIDPKLYGRDDTVNSTIHDITKGKYCGNNLTVLPIVGPGGIGKTTVIQHVYHSQEVQNHFQVKAWICVSLNFNVNKLLEEIKEKIPRVEGEKKEGRKEDTGELIAQRLKSKRFLLILDDMWECSNEDEWKRLLLPFKKSQEKGSMILVTTRFQAIAQMVIEAADHPIDLGGLDREAIRKLFLAFVFGNEQPREDHNMLLEIGYKIVEKIKGSPLAAKTVGRLLRKHLDLDHWRRVLESKEWEMQNRDNDIMPALKLSYAYLPFHLQQCFTYCALFPEDYKFDSNELIHFWIGLDILHSGGQNRKMEDIGQSNLDDLVSFGFFRKDQIGVRPCYIIHDLLHDLALKVASRECLSVQCSNVRSVKIQTSIRHLSVIIDVGDDGDGMADENFKSELRKLMATLKVEALQTLMVFGEMDGSFVSLFGNLFKEAKALRVLHLPRMPFPVESMLHSFSALVHLRYLRLGSEYCGDHWIKLPSSVSRFYHLRILDLEAWECSLDLPRDMSNLAKLRHFLTKNDDPHSAISNVGKIKFLQELKRFQVNKESNGFELKQLGDLAELRGLGIYNLELIQTKEEAAGAKLIGKNHLHKLTLDWESNNQPDLEAQVLESLRPHNSLQELCIRGHGGPSCPTWLGSQFSVKSLHLVGVAWNTLPPLGQMLVHELTLERIATISEFGSNQFGLITKESFSELKRLTLIGLKGLGKWVGETPQLLSGLQVLIIRECPELLELPFMNNHICNPTEQDGNKYWLPNIQEFAIVDCPKVLSLPPIPWTDTLRSVEIRNVGSILDSLAYSKSSSKVNLSITGKDNLHSLDENVLVFDCLTELQELDMWKCPPLELKHVELLTSLKHLRLNYSKNVLGNLRDVEWELPVEGLGICGCDVSGKELTQLLCHLPKLSGLTIQNCEKITLLDVGVEQQPTSTPIRMWDAQATDERQQIAGAVEEEEQEKEEDGLLLFPAHLSDSLQKLNIEDCPELTLLAPPTHPSGHKTGGGLQALRSLQDLRIRSCPKFLSAYKTSFSSTCCCPFPSSLQHLDLVGRIEGMETLEPLSNLTSLTSLEVWGADLVGLGHLLTRGQLSKLIVLSSPKFVGWDPIPVPSSPSSKLRDFWTDDIAGVLAAPICNLLSSSLTKLAFSLVEEVERFTKEQEAALQLLISLQQLQFSLCTKLQCLPTGLNKLTSLKRLEIWRCPAIRSLPKDGLPSSLQELEVRDCGNEELERRCRRLMGTIPKIII